MGVVITLVGLDAAARPVRAGRCPAPWPPARSSPSSTPTACGSSRRRSPAPSRGSTRCPTTSRPRPGRSGPRPWTVVGRVHLPLSKASLLTAAILVGVDALKELPIALLLRPIGFDTLPVWVYNLASESRFQQAALPALTIIAGGADPGRPARPAGSIGATRSMTAVARSRCAAPRSRSAAVRAIDGVDLVLRARRAAGARRAERLREVDAAAHDRRPAGARRGRDRWSPAQTVDDGRRTTPPERRSGRAGVPGPRAVPAPDHRRERRRSASARSRGPPGRRGSTSCSPWWRSATSSARYPHEVSGGERQRASVARAIAPRPQPAAARRAVRRARPQPPGPGAGPAGRRCSAPPRRRRCSCPTTRPRRWRSAIVSRSCGTGASSRSAPARTSTTAPPTGSSPGSWATPPSCPVEHAADGPRTELGPLAADHLTAEAGEAVIVRPADVELVEDETGDAEVTAAEYQGPTWMYTVRLASGAEVTVPPAPGGGAAGGGAGHRPPHHRPPDAGEQRAWYLALGVASVGRS